MQRMQQERNEDRPQQWACEGLHDFEQGIGKDGRRHERERFGVEPVARSNGTLRGVHKVNSVPCALEMWMCGRNAREGTEYRLLKVGRAGHCLAAPAIEARLAFKRGRASGAPMCVRLPMFAVRR